MKLIEADSNVKFIDQVNAAGNEPLVFSMTFKNVAPEDADQLIKAWNADAAFQRTQPGFVSTQLQRGTEGSGIFIDYAWWESGDAFRKCFFDPSFNERLKMYPENGTISPQLYHPVSELVKP